MISDLRLTFLFLLKNQRKKKKKKKEEEAQGASPRRHLTIKQKQQQLKELQAYINDFVLV